MITWNIFSRNGARKIDKAMKFGLCIRVPWTAFPIFFQQYFHIDFTYAPFLCMEFVACTWNPYLGTVFFSFVYRQKRFENKLFFELEYAENFAAILSEVIEFDFFLRSQVYSKKKKLHKLFENSSQNVRNCKFLLRFLFRYCNMTISYALHAPFVSSLSLLDSTRMTCGPCSFAFFFLL